MRNSPSPTCEKEKLFLGGKHMMFSLQSLRSDRLGFFVFPYSSSFRPSSKSPLISTLHYLVQNIRFNYFVPTSGQRISPHNTNLFPLGNNNFPSKRINRQFLLHIPQRLPPNSTRWPSQATETSWLLVPALLNKQSWTIREWIGSITSSYSWRHATSEKKKAKQNKKKQWNEWN